MHGFAYGATALPFVQSQHPLVGATGPFVGTRFSSRALLPKLQAPTHIEEHPMNRLHRIICIGAACAAIVLPMQANAQGAADVPRVNVRPHLALATACPNAFKELPDHLYRAWREIDSAADVLVEFKLDDRRISDVKTIGHVDYFGFVRQAVRSMKCQHAGDGAYAVSFRIRFRYPEDEASGQMAMQFVDERPAVAALETRR
jgi:hypothetical protein